MSRPPKRSTVAATAASTCVRVANVAGEPEAALEPEVVAAAGGEADRRAGLVEHPRDRGADAAARAGDERDSAFEAHEHSFDRGIQGP